MRKVFLLISVLLLAGCGDNPFTIVGNPQPKPETEEVVHTPTGEGGELDGKDAFGYSFYEGSRMGELRAVIVYWLGVDTESQSLTLYSTEWDAPVTLRYYVSEGGYVSSDTCDKNNLKIISVAGIGDKKELKLVNGEGDLVSDLFPIDATKEEFDKLVYPVEACKAEGLSSRCHDTDGVLQYKIAGFTVSGDDCSVIDYDYCEKIGETLIEYRCIEENGIVVSKAYQVGCDCFEGRCLNAEIIEKGSIPKPLQAGMDLEEMKPYSKPISGTVKPHYIDPDMKDWGASDYDIPKIPLPK